MKKVLFASTALVATAGIAAADVAISGYAEMGVRGGSGTTITQFMQDIDVRFTLSGETDGGITFGAGVDLDENAGGSNTDDAGVAVFVSGDFGTLTLGDTDGGFDAGMQEVNIGSGGSIADNETGHAGYSGNSGLDGVYDGQILSYRYSVSGFTITGSIEMDDDANSGAAGPFGQAALTTADGLTGDAIYGIGASYAGTFGGGSYTIGAGYQTTADYDAATAGAQDLTIMGVSATVALDSGLSAGINYSQISTFVVNGDGTHTAFGASYAFDAITLHANYGQFDWDAGAAVADTNGFGLAAAYDLGGGLNAHLGYGSSEVTAVNASTATLGTSSTWSLGLSMSF
ncbi:porin [Rhodobacteraceae bacterium N5(2021)]|uniref:Porin n=1 Tax=Gymnodinialimonas phycosphaerae TaxID=2841589 RepID=A0A975YF91_9RHOB|nr:porin [Gymnodinialimonas phycosphaerae]MBY4894475.1 porin [Gymnodinialimonas phycosphaerae]